MVLGRAGLPDHRLDGGFVHTDFLFHLAILFSASHPTPATIL